MQIHDTMVFMEELSKNKLRTSCAIAFVVVAFIVSVLSLVKFKEKSMTAIKLRIVSAELNQAITYSINDNGSPCEWNLLKKDENEDVLNTTIFKYFQTEQAYSKNTQRFTSPNNYKALNTKKTNLNLTNFPTIALKNGATLSIEVQSSCKNQNQTCANIYVDLNGKNKPNTIGKDLFVFVLQNNPNNPIITFGENSSEQEIKQDKLYGCNKKSQLAYTCSSLIKENNWQIKRNYPW